jgi:hypothetical protein
VLNGDHRRDGLPAERGRYSGYLGGVMAGATAAGPFARSVIVDLPLGGAGRSSSSCRWPSSPSSCSS